MAVVAVACREKVDLLLRQSVDRQPELSSGLDGVLDVL